MNIICKYCGSPNVVKFGGYQDFTNRHESKNVVIQRVLYTRIKLRLY